MMSCTFSKASWHSIDQWNGAPFFKSGAKAEVTAARPGINLLMYDSLPKKLFSSLCVVCGFIVAMADALARSTLIPRWCTRKPRNLPAETPNAHLKGFILSLYSRHFLNTFFKIPK
jgi:hypothetical protein